MTHDSIMGSPDGKAPTSPDKPAVAWDGQGKPTPVAWRGDDAEDGTRRFTAIERVAELWTEQRLAVTPLYDQSIIDALTARAEGAEVERLRASMEAADYKRGYAIESARAEAAEARLSEAVKLLGALTRTVEDMRVPQNAAEAAVQVTLTIGPLVTAARSFLATQGEHHGG